MTDLLTGRRILVVEDEMLVLMNIEMALEDLGCSAISPAATVADALNVLSSHQFDAALVDVNLGGEKSYPVADALAQRGIPFAFCTGAEIMVTVKTSTDVRCSKSRTYGQIS